MQRRHEFRLGGERAFLRRLRFEPAFGFVFCGAGRREQQPRQFLLERRLHARKLRKMRQRILRRRLPHRILPGGIELHFLLRRGKRLHAAPFPIR